MKLSEIFEEISVLSVTESPFSVLRDDNSIRIHKFREGNLFEMDKDGEWKQIMVLDWMNGIKAFMPQGFE
jgi:hypothetical protein